jgi:hypothetical protein
MRIVSCTTTDYVQHAPVCLKMDVALSYIPPSIQSASIQSASWPSLEAEPNDHLATYKYSEYISESTQQSPLRNELAV